MLVNILMLFSPVRKVARGTVQNGTGKTTITCLRKKFHVQITVHKSFLHCNFRRKTCQKSVPNSVDFGLVNCCKIRSIYCSKFTGERAKNGTVKRNHPVPHVSNTVHYPVLFRYFSERAKIRVFWLSKLLQNPVQFRSKIHAYTRNGTDITRATFLTGQGCVIINNFKFYNYLINKCINDNIYLYKI